VKKIKSHYIPIALMALLVTGIADWTSFSLDSRPSLIAIAEASGDKDKDKDKDDDVDYTKADCKDNTGICSNQGTVTITGMTGDVDVRSGSGAVLLDVTSENVDLESMSGDLTGNGLTGKGDFETEVGNVRVKYCKKTQDITDNSLDKLTVKINDSVGDAGSDAKLAFPKDSTIDIKISYDETKYKSDFSDCSGCDFELKGSVENGFLVIYEYTLPTPNCPY